jgi:hypothetical protein
MDRNEKFAHYKKHPHYGSAIAKLPGVDIRFIEEFIAKHKDESSGVWSVSTRKAFVDNPKKPKNWATLYELLQILA